MTLRQARAALVAQLEAATGIRGADTWPDTIQPPMAVVRPLSGSYTESFDDDAVAHQLELTVLLQLGSLAAAQEELDGYLDPQGEWSIRGAIVADPTLGGTVNSTLVRGYRDYGGLKVGMDADGNGPEYLGVKFDIEVLV